VGLELNFIEAQKEQGTDNTKAHVQKTLHDKKKHAVRTFQKNPQHTAPLQNNHSDLKPCDHLLLYQERDRSQLPFPTQTRKPVTNLASLYQSNGRALKRGKGGGTRRPWMRKKKMCTLVMNL
jgi:hypothetical protein